jgi:hypothetical protein
MHSATNLPQNLVNSVFGGPYLENGSSSSFRRITCGLRDARASQRNRSAVPRFEMPLIWGLRAAHEGFPESAGFLGTPTDRVAWRVL